MIEVLSLLFVGLGAFFVLVASIGVLRFPDTLTRLHAATKAGAFGTALILVAAILHFQSGEVFVKSLLAMAFFYLTAPIASHLLGRVAYRHRSRRQPLNLKVDEWKAHAVQLKASQNRDDEPPLPPDAESGRAS